MTHIENLTQELRRGVIVLAILNELKEPQYGYSLMKRIAEKGLEIDQGTLYPLLRRLESRGLLDSEWKVEGSPRRYYVISSEGEKLLPLLIHEWEAIVQIMKGFLYTHNGGNNELD